MSNTISRWALDYATEELNSAAIAVHNEVDSRGLKIFLCQVSSRESVEMAIKRITEHLSDHHIRFGERGKIEDDPDIKLVAARHLAKLSMLYFRLLSFERVQAEYNKAEYSKW